MIYRIKSFQEIDRRKLMDVYGESNWLNIPYFYPDMEDKERALKLIENGFLTYLETDFFAKPGNEYWVLEENGVWVSALRLYFLKNGEYYIEALETHPSHRKKGYGSRLIQEMQTELEKDGSYRISDLVSRKNTASLNTHFKCGFIIVADPGLDRLSGELDERSYGLEYCSGKKS